jgi:hypothetical protein
MEALQISEFLSNLNLVQLVIQQDFIAFIHCERLKSYTSIVLEIFNFQVTVYDPSTPQWCPVLDVIISEQSLTALAITNIEQ